MSSTKYDLVVIGAGPGGYVAALRASQLGLKVALVEKDAYGGICLNWGCIPTKALLRSAEIFRLVSRAEEFGVTASTTGADLAAMVARSRAVSGKLAQGVEYLLKRSKVSLMRGHARLMSSSKVEVSNAEGAKEILETRNVIVATGARPRALNGFDWNDDAVWDYRKALVPASLPKRLLVIGAGAIGCEFASFYSTFGADVTLVEAKERILPSEENEISAYVKEHFEKDGIKVSTATIASFVKKTDEGIVVQLQTGTATEQITVDIVLVAVGIVPNIEDVGLQELGVELENGVVRVDRWGETNVSGVFALGDIVKGPWLAHKASREAIIAVERIAGLESASEGLAAIPACTYSHPQVASIGLTEQQAIDQGREIKVGKVHFSGNGKALAVGEAGGFVKAIFDAQTGELIGAHMVGEGVTEMIQGFGIAMAAEATEAEIIETIFPHPTMSESMQEAVLKAFGRAIHY